MFFRRREQPPSPETKEPKVPEIKQLRGILAELSRSFEADEKEQRVGAEKDKKLVDKLLQRLDRAAEILTTSPYLLRTQKEILVGYQAYRKTAGGLLEDPDIYKFFNRRDVKVGRVYTREELNRWERYGSEELERIKREGEFVQGSFSKEGLKDFLIYLGADRAFEKGNFKGYYGMGVEFEHEKGLGETVEFLEKSKDLTYNLGLPTTIEGVRVQLDRLDTRGSKLYDREFIATFVLDKELVARWSGKR